MIEFKKPPDKVGQTINVSLRPRLPELCVKGERLRHAGVCRHLGVLTPAEVRGVREQYGMTKAAFAEATAIGEATLGRWETGAVIQNRASDFYLRLVRIPFVMGILKDLSSVGDAARQ